MPIPARSLFSPIPSFVVRPVCELTENKISCRKKGTVKGMGLSKGVKTIETDRSKNDEQHISIKRRHQMTMKKLTIALIAGLFLIINLGAQQFGRNEGRRGSKGKNQMRMVRILENNQKKLGITDAQLKEIKGLHESMAEKNVQLENKANLLDLELSKLMNQDKKEYEKIKSTMNQLSEIRTERRINGLKTHDSVMRILSPEQLEKIRSEFQGFMMNHQRQNKDRPMRSHKNRGQRRMNNPQD